VGFLDLVGKRVHAPLDQPLELLLPGDLLVSFF
jgi:hypothetical protein